jgi:predicted GNAT family acetyltransferase
LHNVGDYGINPLKVIRAMVFVIILYGITFTYSAHANLLHSQDQLPNFDLANRCQPLDLHTPFTYWVISKYFGKNSFILESNNQNIGFITSIYNDQFFCIWQIGIIDEYRKKGLSTLLIDKAINYAVAKNYKTIQVSIAPNNKDSYCSFVNYSIQKGYSMTKVSDLTVLDSIIQNFEEQEDLFEIEIPPN